MSQADLIFLINARTGEAISEIKKVHEALKALGTAGQDAGKNAKGGIIDLKGSLSEAKNAFLAIGGAIAGVFALNSLKNFATAMFQSAASGEASALRVEQALARQGESALAYKDRLFALSAEMQRTTIYADGMIEAAMATGLDMNIPANKLERFTKTAIDLATVLGTDVETAMKALGGTLDGTIGKIGEKIPEMKKLTEEELKQGKALEYLEARYKGAAIEAGDTLQGALAKLKNQYDTTLESIALAITGTDSMKDAVIRLRDWLIEVTPTLQNWAAAIAQSTKAVAAFISELKFLGEDGKQNDFSDQATRAFHDAGIAVDEAKGKVETLKKALLELSDPNSDFAQKTAFEGVTIDKARIDTLEELKRAVKEVEASETLLAKTREDLAAKREAGNVAPEGTAPVTPDKPTKNPFVTEVEGRAFPSQSTDGDGKDKKIVSDEEKYLKAIEKRVKAEDLLKTLEEQRKQILIDVSSSKLKESQIQDHLTLLAAQELDAKKDIEVSTKEIAKLGDEIGKRLTANSEALSEDAIKRAVIAGTETKYADALSKKLDAETGITDMVAERRSILRAVEKHQMTELEGQDRLRLLAAQEAAMRREIEDATREIAKYEGQITGAIKDQASLTVSEFDPVAQIINEDAARKKAAEEQVNQLLTLNGLKRVAQDDLSNRQRENLTLEKEDWESMTDSARAYIDTLRAAEDAGVTFADGRATSDTGTFSDEQLDKIREVTTLQLEMESQLKDVREDKLEQLDRLIEAESSYTDVMEAAAAAGIKLSEAEKEDIKTKIQHQAQTDRMNKLGSMFTGGLKNMASSFVDMALSGKLSMKALLHEFLNTIAKQAAVEALFQLAKGFALLATGNMPGAASAFTSAAIFGGVAVAAGIAAKATAPKGGSEGASASSGGSTGTSSSGENPNALTSSVAPAAPVINETTIFTGSVVGTSPRALAQELQEHRDAADREQGGRRPSKR